MYTLRLTLVSMLALTSVSASAGLRELGTDYRMLRSNYTMLETIQDRCPDFKIPEMVDKQTVNKELEAKLGYDMFARIYGEVAKSDLKLKAKKTVNTLFEQIEGCEDPKLLAVVNRIAEVQGETYARFTAEPAAAVAPNAVPVPMRRSE
ncbi:hypothetical protein QWI17_22525 [Gilvimarinus sp. SDUM040013]|uniref:Secreted protein n=1 Tax=Gilvimarinus gilvus TaxID=3058038 RepID=A0ABU4S2R1_9GAMM|nr:hypothetical protein [Gilvimarinus sp. SDUM040013]MDO3388639.1 hypothetical protein [Gilvimarinus sp. SDUM040013]MDX6849534.1 hypothetical protein [Gilvimarinus sp. SDUM040013]